MQAAALLRLLHAALGVAFIAGLLGRAAAFRHARRAPTLDATAALMELSDWFERALVIPGSMLILLSGIVIGWMGHWPLLTPAGHPTWLLVSLVLLLPMVGFIPAVLVPERARRRAALAAALKAGRRSPELDAALARPIVLRLRRLELLIIALVFALMMLKPF